MAVGTGNFECAFFHLHKCFLKGIVARGENADSQHVVFFPQFSTLPTHKVQLVCHAHLFRRLHLLSKWTGLSLYSLEKIYLFFCFVSYKIVANVFMCTYVISTLSL